MAAYLIHQLISEALLFVMIGLFLFFYFNRMKKPITTKKQNPEITPDGKNYTIVTPPTFRVIFNQEIDEEFTKELADMFINQRTFYYQGSQKKPENSFFPKENDIYVSYENVQWDLLKKVKV